METIRMTCVSGEKDVALTGTKDKASREISAMPVKELAELALKDRGTRVDGSSSMTNSFAGWTALTTMEKEEAPAVLRTTKI